MPEEVRQARTTGGTYQHNKSQEVKDGPEGRTEMDGKSEYLMVDSMYGRGEDIKKNDTFDKEANYEIDCLMRLIAPKNYETEEVTHAQLDRV